MQKVKPLLFLNHAWSLRKPGSLGFTQVFFIKVMTKSERGPPNLDVCDFPIEVIVKKKKKFKFPLEMCWKVPFATLKNYSKIPELYDCGWKEIPVLSKLTVGANHVTFLGWL